MIENKTWAEEAAERNRNRIPYTTEEGGRYDDASCRSFIRIQKMVYMQTAKETESRLNQCFEMVYGLHQDVGFMYQLSAVADYRITGS